MDYKRSLKMTSGALALSVTWSTFATAALQCPAQPLDAARAATIAAVLPAGDAFDDRAALATAVTALHAEGVGLPMIVDNLIAAYCPTVAEQTGLSHTEKTAKVNQFAARITRAVYQLDSADAIVLEVTFPPLVMDSINTKAKESGASAADWVQGVVELALDR